MNYNITPVKAVCQSAVRPLPSEIIVISDVNKIKISRQDRYQTIRDEYQDVKLETKTKIKLFATKTKMMLTVKSEE